MERIQRTVSELASLFRMLQVIPESEGISKVYLMLLAFGTTWRTFGFERAFLMLVDDRQRVVRGRLAAEQAADSEVDDGEASFEELAKRVFDTYDQIDSSDLTLKTRAFSVPLDWKRSAITRTAVAGQPTLADKSSGEFRTDPFLNFFDSRRYVVVPVKVNGVVMAVLAADNSHTDRDITVEDISVLFSLAQHAALSIERLLARGDNRRKFRILRKLQETLRGADTSERLNEGLNLALSMVCRAASGSGCLLKDSVRGKTVHIKAVDEFTVEAGAADLSIAGSLDAVLDRASGGAKPVKGDSSHPLLDELASETIRYFYATPLAVPGECHGALAVYAEKTHATECRTNFSIKDRVFLDLCAGIIAERLNIAQQGRTIDRYETIIEEFRSNLERERAASRAGDRAAGLLISIPDHIERIKTALRGTGSADERIERVMSRLEAFEADVNSAKRDLDRIKLNLARVDLFEIVADCAERWKPRAQSNGVEVTIRIPNRGPALLMNAPRIAKAFDNIFRAMTSCVTEGDRVLVECKADEDRALVCIADTGHGLPGTLLSRLFMPFADSDDGDDHTGAMSLAGDVLQQHGGEIHIRSSSSWNTILVVSFPIAANRDRRQERDRRTSERDRRTPASV